MYGIVTKNVSNNGYPEPKNPGTSTSTDYRLTATGHVHKAEISKEGTLRLDADAVEKGELYGFMYPEMKLLIGKELSIINMWERLKDARLPDSQELLAIISKLKKTGVLESTTLLAESSKVNLKVLRISNFFTGEIPRFPLLKKLHGVIVDQDGNLVSALPDLPKPELYFDPDNSKKQKIEKIYNLPEGEAASLLVLNGKWMLIDQKTLKPSKLDLSFGSELEKLDQNYSYNLLKTSDGWVLRSVFDIHTLEFADDKVITDVSHQTKNLKPISEFQINPGILAEGNSVGDMLKHASDPEGLTGLGPVQVSFYEDGLKETVTIVGGWWKSREIFQSRLNWDSIRSLLEQSNFKPPSVSEQIDLLQDLFNYGFVRSELEARIKVFIKRAGEKAEDLRKNIDRLLQDYNKQFTQVPDEVSISNQERFKRMYERATNKYPNLPEDEVKQIAILSFELQNNKIITRSLNNFAFKRVAEEFKEETFMDNPKEFTSYQT
jgi:ElaB/YqjD/DUF883 family membrane-anchored ribosome-binding protein